MIKIKNEWEKKEIKKVILLKAKLNLVSEEEQKKVSKKLNDSINKIKEEGSESSILFLKTLGI